MDDGLHMRRLSTLLSLVNLTRHRAHPRGQIATFLLLGLVAVLVFAIATANLGQLSLTTIKASNAADSAALLLGSQLATKANQQWQTLGERIEKCKRTGFLGIVLAIVFAVIAIASCVYAGCVGLGVYMAVGAAGGFVGGAIGGAIVHGTLEGALVGALQGAMIGAAIGGGYAGIANPSGFAGAGGATLEVGAGAAAGPGAGTGGLMTVAPLAPIPAGGTLLAGSTISSTGLVASGTLAVGGGLYSGAVQEQMTSDAFTVAAKGISGLPELDQIRESVFLNALALTVNDPNRTAKDEHDTAACYWPTPVDDVGKVQVIGDPNDADADGNKTESIPCFEYWWDQRITKLKEGIPQLQADVEAFLNGPMSTFETAAETTYLGSGGGSRCGDQVCDPDEYCGWVNQCETDCHEECNPDQGD